MPDWPSRCPPELHAELTALANYRSRPTAQDMWTVFVQVMKEKGVSAPEFDAWPEIKGGIDQ